MKDLVAQMIPSPHGGLIHPKDPGEPGGKCFAKRWSVTQTDAAVLQALAKGRRVIEIGTGLGVSSASMAEVGASVVTIDIDPWVAETVAPHLPDSVRFELGRDGVGDGERFDLAFIDGLHTPEAVQEDIAFVIGKLDLPAVIALHDAGDENVQQGIEMAGFSPADVAYVPTKAGIALLFVGDRAQ